MFVLALSALVPADASAEVPFGVRFSANVPGDITLIGNTLETCPASAQCSAAQSGANASNNGFTMGFVDVDADGTTFNSSSATLSLPAGATVLFAGLYYGGRTSAGTGGAAAPNTAARGAVSLKPPGASSYQALAATVFDSTIVSRSYQGFVDVTALVAAAGQGVYTVANVQAGTGADRYAGWSIVVAYESFAQPPRNLTVFDGLQAIGTGDPPLSVPVTGFQTPPTGAVRSDVGFVVYEGDRGFGGDQAKLNGQPLQDSANPANNFFNSAISLGGVPFTAKTPNYDNQLGLDAVIVDADGYLPNGATSATIELSTNGEQYILGMIAFATELYAPNVTATKTVIDANGGQVVPGDTLEYSIMLTNTGGDDATDVVLTDLIPAGTTYSAGSLAIDAAAKTDAVDTDEAEFLPAANQVRFRLGAGANSAAGGTLAPGASTSVTFDVVVNAGIADSSEITNSATASFFARTLGSPLQAGATAAIEVSAPDLTIEKTHTGSFSPNGTFRIDVSNVGSADTQGPITVTDTFPTGLSLPASPYVFNAWTCTFAGQSMTCTYGAPSIVAGTNAFIDVPVTLVSGSAADIENSATVSGGTDGNPTNNSSTDQVVVTPFADLGIGKTVVPAVVAAGEQATYTLLVTNNGLFDAQNVAVADTLPGAVSLVSASATQGTCTGAVSCSLGDLAAGATATITIVVTAQTAGTSAGNTATVSSSTTDPVATNDSAAVDLTVAPTADLSVTKTIAPSLPSQGTIVAFTVTAQNDGPSSADNVVVTDQFPAIGSFVSGTPSQGVLDAGTGTWVVGTLANGASATLVVQWQLPGASGGETLTNAAAIRSNTRDGNPENDTTSTSELITPAADLSLTKFVTPVGAGAGEIVTYTLTVTNNGPGSAESPSVTDELPAALTFLSSTDGCAAVGQVVTCSAGDLDPGETATLTILAVVADGAGAIELENSASTASATPDPIPSSNQATEAFTIGESPAGEGASSADAAGGTPACDPLVQPCAPPVGSDPGPPSAPGEESESGPATAQPRVPDLRGSVRALWNGETLRVVLRVRIARPRLVDAFGVRLSIQGALTRSVRIAAQGRRSVKLTLEIAGSTLTADPEGRQLVAVIDPGSRIAETRERNNTAVTRVL